MNSKRRKNTVGALFFDIKLKDKNKKKKKSTRYRDNRKDKKTEYIKVTTMPYYKTDKNDYKRPTIILPEKKIILPDKEEEQEDLSILTLKI